MYCQAWDKDIETGPGWRKWNPAPPRGGGGNDGQQTKSGAFFPRVLPYATGGPSSLSCCFPMHYIHFIILCDSYNLCTLINK